LTIWNWEFGKQETDDVRKKTVTEVPLPWFNGLHKASALCVSALLLTFSAPPLRAEVIDRVMAVVGTAVVTLSDVRAAETFGLTSAAAPADVLAALIDRELMLGEVDRYAAPDPEPGVLDRRLAQIQARFPNRAQYDEALARTAMTELRLRAFVSENLRVESYVDQRFGSAAQPTADEVLRYYREHPAEFTRAGRLAPFAEVQPATQQKLAADRRRALVAEWLDRLRRRGGVRIVGQPVPVGETKWPGTSAAAVPRT
jgi:hypothetical protein